VGKEERACHSQYTAKDQKKSKKVRSGAKRGRVMSLERFIRLGVAEYYSSKNPSWPAR